MKELYAFRHTLFEFLRPRRLVVWLLAAAALYVIGRIFRYVNPSAPAQSNYSMLSAILVYRLLPLAAAVFSTQVLSAEVEQKTIVYLLTRPIHRWRLLLARTLAAILVIMIVSWAGAYAVSFATYGGRPNPYLSRDLVAMTVGAVAYGALFTFLSLLVNRSMLISLIFAFGWEFAVTTMPGDLYWLSVNPYLTSLAERPAVEAPSGVLDVLSGSMGLNTIPPSTAWTVVLILSAACLAGAAWWFTHFEYVPREDAE